MTPQEKAKELFEKFFNYYPNQDVQFIAKQVALDVVNEILSEYKRISVPYLADKSYILESEYWNEVKQNLEKL